MLWCEQTFYMSSVTTAYSMVWKMNTNYWETHGWNGYQWKEMIQTIQK